MPVTITDIAQHLNLSVSTVSKALNGYSDVSKKTRDLVQDAARELNYHPSSAARNLRRQRTEKIGYLFSYPISTVSEYVMRLITGAMAAAEQAGYNLILYPLLGDSMAQSEQICRSREVDGVLLMSTEKLDKIAAMLKTESIPFVVVGQRATQPHCASYITPDNVTAGRLATQHLLDLGHRRIAYTARPILTTTSHDRFDGYCQALAALDVPYDEQLIIHTDPTMTDLPQRVQHLLTLPAPPTAIIAIHDLIAFELLEILTDMGIRVPQQMALVGSDNWRFSQTTNPPLTTIQPPLFEIGRQATEALLARIADNTHPPIQRTLPVELIIRQSTVG